MRGLRTRAVETRACPLTMGNNGEWTERNLAEAFAAISAAIDRAFETGNDEVRKTVMAVFAFLVCRTGIDPCSENLRLIRATVGRMWEHIERSEVRMALDWNGRSLP